MIATGFLLLIIGGAHEPLTADLLEFSHVRSDSVPVASAAVLRPELPSVDPRLAFSLQTPVDTPRTRRRAIQVGGSIACRGLASDLGCGELTISAIKMAEMLHFLRGYLSGAPLLGLVALQALDAGLQFLNFRHGRCLLRATLIQVLAQN